MARPCTKHVHKVFTFEGEPVKQVNTKAWKKALNRAGIEDFRWHDVGILARSERNPASRPSGARRMAVSDDGAPVCAFRSRTSGRLR